jgi:hypothetical protein
MNKKRILVNLSLFMGLIFTVTGCGVPRYSSSTNDKLPQEYYTVVPVPAYAYDYDVVKIKPNYGSSSQIIALMEEDTADKHGESKRSLQQKMGRVI